MKPQVYLESYPPGVPEKSCGCGKEKIKEKRQKRREDQWIA
jgi:hypothetical protein